MKGAAPLALGALGALGYATLLRGLSGLPVEVELALALPVLLGVHLGAALWVWRRPWTPAGPFLVAAVAFRLLAAGAPPALSSDVYRYAWDGRVQRAGWSPYAAAPGDPALAPLRDAEMHPRINRPLERTVYPPGAQVLFRAMPYDVDRIRWTFVALDLVTMLLLVRLLHVLALPAARVVVYAWSPLAVLEIGNNGHLEAAVLPLLVGLVLAHRAGRHRWAAVLLGGAAALKLYPVLALAASTAGSGARRRAAAIAGVALVLVPLYLGYGASVGPRVLGFLPRYFRSYEDHNIGIRAAIEAALPGSVPHPREVAMGACVVLLVAGLAAIHRQAAPIELRMLQVAGLYVLTLATALHPWYALWVLPWTCVHPRASWLWLGAALPLSYLKYATADGVMPAWVVPVEIGPTLALLALEARGALRWR